MGLLTGLLTLPLAPARLSWWVVGQLADEADRQSTDPEPLRRELAALAQAVDAGEISEEEFDRREDELLDRLDELARLRAARGRQT